MSLYVLAFVAMAGIDTAWVAYMWAVESRKPVVAGLVASGLYVSSGVLTILYVNDPAVLVAGALGAIVGTAAAVMIAKRKDEAERARRAAEVGLPRRAWSMVSAREAAAFIDGSPRRGHGDDRL